MIQTMNSDGGDCRSSDESSCLSSESSLSSETMNRTRPESKNKFRSLRLSRLPSLKRTLKLVSSSEQFDANKNNFQISGRTLSTQSSLRFKKKPKKSRPIRLVNEVSFPSESDYGSINGSTISTTRERSKSASPGNNLARKPVRILSKRGSLRKCSQDLHSSDSSIHRKTCSSALKDKFPDHVEKSEENGVLKVCTYSYCSLHGHRHASSTPSLKRFLSRKRMQKGSKAERKSTSSARASGKGQVIVNENDFLQSDLSKSIDAMEGQTAGNDLSQNALFEKGKYAGLWRLIYKEMVSEKGEKDGMLMVLDKENGNGDSGHRSEVEKDLGSGDSHADSQEFGLDQIDAVRLVQEAIDSILSPDEQTVASGMVSNSVDHVDDDVPAKFEQAEDGKGSSKERNRLSLEPPNKWNKLKRVIAMKRFVKAMERVRNINPRRPRCLALEPDPEPEKVHLRRQMTEERKNAEEWMLDFALRQVISKLDSAQKKRVSSLVDAFEMVSPAQEVHGSPRFPTPSSHRKPVRVYNEFVPSGEASIKGNVHKLMAVYSNETPDPEIGSYEDQQHHLPETLKVEWHNEVARSQLKQTSSELCCTEVKLKDADWKKDRAEINLNRDRPRVRDEMILKTDIEEVIEAEEVVKETTQTCNSGCSNGAVDPNGAVTERGEHFDVSESLPSKIGLNMTKVSEVVTPDPLEEPTVVSEGNIEEGSLTVQESEPRVTQAENASQMRLWHLIYKNMAIDITVNETQLVSDGNANTDLKHQNSFTQKTELQKIEAIKLVREAIDKILLPELEDPLSDDQSNTEDIAQEQGLIEKNGDEQVIAVTIIEEKRHPADQSNIELPDTEEELLKCHITSNGEEGKENLKVGQSAKQQKPSSWSNLRKLILLKRFITALEKVKKFTPREPRFLAMESDPEAEKVNLRHQNNDERKGGEEWMLDYALQQVVSQLNPARKRKVKLLVEAFETVIPTI